MAPILDYPGYQPNAKAANSLVIDETKSSGSPPSIWSRMALEQHHDATFIVGAEPVTVSNIAITEINYNPLAPTKEELGRNPALKAGDFEFIELKNLGDDQSTSTKLNLKMECKLHWKLCNRFSTHALLTPTLKLLDYVTAMTYLSQAPLKGPCETVAKS